MDTTPLHIPAPLADREMQVFSLRGRAYVFDVESGLALGAGALEEADPNEVAELLEAAAADEQPEPELPRGHVALMWAGECNLACTYCHAEGCRQPGTEVSEDLIEQTIAFGERLLDDGCRLVSFTSGFDGEPLLRLPLLRRVAEAVREFGSNGLRLSITTNGTLVTPDIVSELEELGVDVGISLDGPREIHDAHRRFPNGEPTYDAVLPAVFALRQSRLERLRNAPAFVTLVPGTSRPKVVAEHLVGLGFPRFTMVPARRRVGAEALWSVGNLRALADAYGEYADYLVDALGGGDRRVLAGINPGDLLGRFVIALCGRSRSKYGCGAGRFEWAVGPDGRLYPCAAFYGAERSPALRCVSCRTEHEYRGRRATPAPGSGRAPRGVSTSPEPDKRQTRSGLRPPARGGMGRLYGSWNCLNVRDVRALSISESRSSSDRSRKAAMLT